MESRFKRFTPCQTYKPASYGNSPIKGRRRDIWNWLDDEFLRFERPPKIDDLLRETGNRDKEWLSLHSKDAYVNVKIEYAAWKAYHLFFNHISR